eukprot:scaffold7841_cov128-Isochrysis_galbana.AAC.4
MREQRTIAHLTIRRAETRRATRRRVTRWNVGTCTRVTTRTARWLGLEPSSHDSSARALRQTSDNCRDEARSSALQ